MGFRGLKGFRGWGFSIPQRYLLPFLGIGCITNTPKGIPHYHPASGLPLGLGRLSGALLRESGVVGVYGVYGLLAFAASRAGLGSQGLRGLCWDVSLILTVLDRDGSTPYCNPY